MDSEDSALVKTFLSCGGLVASNNDSWGPPVVMGGGGGFSRVVWMKF